MLEPTNTSGCGSPDGGAKFDTYLVVMRKACEEQLKEERLHQKNKIGRHSLNEPWTLRTQTQVTVGSPDIFPPPTRLHALFKHSLPWYLQVIPFLDIILPMAPGEHMPPGLPLTATLRISGFRDISLQLRRSKRKRARNKKWKLVFRV